MIDTIDQQLQDWLAGVAGVDVVLAPPNEMDQQKAISLYLLDILPAATVAQTRRVPFHFNLRYLVTAWADEAKLAHHLLAEVLMAAMDHADYQVQAQPFPALFWRAFDMAPQPGFYLTAPMQVSRPDSKAPPISMPIEIQTANTVWLRGIVLSPRRKPVPGAQVELRNHRMRTRTDDNGHFEFTLVPVKPVKKDLLVQTRSSDFEMTLDTSAGVKQPVEILLSLVEG